MIRPIKSDDAAQICDIYNHYVRETVVTFEESPVSTAEMMGSDMDRFPVSLVRGAIVADARGSRSTLLTEPVELRPVFDRGSRLAPASCGGDLESHYRGPGLLIWAERCAGSLLVLVSCSVVQFDPSGRTFGHPGPERERSGRPGGSAAPRRQRRRPRRSMIERYRPMSVLFR